MSGFWIGNFDFINMSRVPSGAMTQLDREVRPGVNGVTVWDTGSRSTPFQVLTAADTVDVLNARAALRQYQAIAGRNPVELWFAGVFDSMVIVHHVDSIDDGIYQTLLGVGGRLGTSHGMIRALWTLEYWPNVPQQ